MCVCVRAQPIVLLVVLLYIRMELIISAITNSNNSMTLEEFWEQEIKQKASDVG